MTKTIILTRDITFLQKSYGEYSKAEKPVLVVMRYEGSDNYEELRTAPVVNTKNNVNIVSDSNNDDDIENDNKTFFDKDINDEVKVTPKTTINTKVM